MEVLKRTMHTRHSRAQALQGAFELSCHQQFLYNFMRWTCFKVTYVVTWRIREHPICRCNKWHYKRPTGRSSMHGQRLASMGWALDLPSSERAAQDTTADGFSARQTPRQSEWLSFSCWLIVPAGAISGVNVLFAALSLSGFPPEILCPCPRSETPTARQADTHATTFICRNTKAPVAVNLQGHGLTPDNMIL